MQLEEVRGRLTAQWFEDCYNNPMNLHPMEDAPRDGTEVILFQEQATQIMCFNAAWSDGSLWDMQGYDSREEAQGWWYFISSVTELRADCGKLIGWLPMPYVAQNENSS
ncbi:MAG: hypothetical protein KDI08_07245 [Pseudomonadales bacterium]|nr:hypothetical protein [Pseudomonadales bacterium]